MFLFMGSIGVFRGLKCKVLVFLELMVSWRSNGVLKEVLLL